MNENIMSISKFAEVIANDISAVNKASDEMSDNSNLVQKSAQGTLTLANLLNNMVSVEP